MKLLFSVAIVLVLTACDFSHLESAALQETMRKPVQYQPWQAEYELIFVENLGEVAPQVNVNRILVKRLSDNAEFCVLASSLLEFAPGENVQLVETHFNHNPFVSTRVFFIKKSQ